MQIIGSKLIEYNVKEKHVSFLQYGEHFVVKNELQIFGKHGRVVW